MFRKSAGATEQLIPRFLCPVVPAFERNIVALLELRGVNDLALLIEVRGRWLRRMLRIWIGAETGKAIKVQICTMKKPARRGAAFLGNPKLLKEATL